jgi:hypothetical protein
MPVVAAVGICEAVLLRFADYHRRWVSGGQGPALRSWLSKQAMGKVANSTHQERSSTGWRAMRSPARTLLKNICFCFQKNCP